MKKTTIYFAIIMLTGTTSADHIESKLAQGRALFYKDIGCTPLSEEGLHYECPDFKQIIHTDKCFFDGEEYDLGTELLSDSGIGRLCRASCHCQKSFSPFNDEIAKFDCNYINCTEFYEDLPEEAGPEYIRTLEDCCATGDIYGAELDLVGKCEFEGKTYYEGDKMIPEGDCYTCKCVKDFDNSTVVDNPNCQQDECLVRFYHSESIYLGCAPIFYNTLCCPVEYRCPFSIDTVISQGQPEDGICKFGDLEVGVGGEIDVHLDDVVCRCVAPPFIECFWDKYLENSR